MTQGDRPLWRIPGAMAYNGYVVLSAFAEGFQGVVVLWVTYALTGSATVVGVVVVLGYLPAAIVGLLFRHHADRGEPLTVTSRTNLLLSVVSLLLAGQQALSDSIWISVIVLGASRVALSLVKMLNKASLSRVVRGSFAPAAARRVIGAASSGSLVAQVVGAGAAGMLLSHDQGVVGLLIAGMLYSGSALCMALGRRTLRVASVAPDAAPALPLAEAAAGDQSGSPHRRLRSVLAYSVPSSGGLQFLNVLLPPLAHVVAPTNSGFYAVLSVASTVGASLAGLAVSTVPGALSLVLRHGLLVAGMLCAAVAAVPAPVTVVAVILALTLAVTAHVVCMQVATNQLPCPAEVGSFTVSRDVTASFAKSTYALAGGLVIEHLGVSAGVIVVGSLFAGVWVCWQVARPWWATRLA